MSKHSPQEFRYRFGNEMRRARLEHGFETVNDLSRATRIPEQYLIGLELGDFNSLTTLFRLARFYNKKIKIEFFT